MSDAIITALQDASTLAITGNTGIAAVLPVTLNTGIETVTVATDATGAWLFTEPLPIPLPAPGTTYAITATWLPPAVAPAPVVATTTVVIPAAPTGLSLSAPPTVVGTLMLAGVPSVSGTNIVFPFTGNWAATAELATFTVDGKVTSTGWKNPGTAGNAFYVPTGGLAAGAHVAAISMGLPAAASITWAFVYEPA
jgi:hypothetical protein